MSLKAFGTALILLTSGVSAATPYYFIIVRQSPSRTLPGPLSAQFKQVHPADQATTWNCKSGLTPITYPSGTEQQVKAKSMDLEVGSVVECLGLVVSVVVGQEVRLWRGETSGCDPGFVTTTTELAWNETGVSEYFKLIPTTQFSVYSVRPSVECAKQSIKYIDHPKLQFKFSNVLSKCLVVSGDLDVVTCNLTIAAGEFEIVAQALGTTEIHVPKFIWRWQIDTKTIKCSCTCSIKKQFSASTTDITTSINYEKTENNDPSGSDQYQGTESTPHPDKIPDSLDCNYLLLLLVVLSAMLLLSFVSVIFFFNLTRSLKRQLNNLNRTCPHTRPPPPDVEPPSVHYSRVHRFTNECHHYNTVSLRLSDSIGLETKGSGSEPSLPVYQKLRSIDVEDC